MRRGWVGLALAAALLAACGQGDFKSEGIAREEAQGYAATAAPPPLDAIAMDRPVPAQESAGGETSTAPQPNQPGPSPVLYLAYAYAVGLELPGDRLIGVMDAHARACQDAGPRLCQLVGSNRSGDPQTQLWGNVSIRGEPQWLRGFMNGLEAQAESAGGKIVSSSTSTEDLTRQIVDTEAVLEAQRTLRERLRSILASRPGRLADLLEVERELARVQAQIDAAESNLAVMRTRVSMSELSLSYQSAPRPLRADTFRPLTEAFAGFLGWVVQGFAAIITFIAVLLPFAIVLGPIAWLLLRWRRRRGGRFFGRRPAEPAATPATEA